MPRETELTQVGRFAKIFQKKYLDTSKTLCVYIVVFVHDMVKITIFEHSLPNCHCQFNNVTLI